MNRETILDIIELVLFIIGLIKIAILPENYGLNDLLDAWVPMLISIALANIKNKKEKREG